MATRALQPARYLKGRGGNPPEFEELTVAGTEIAGDFVVKANNAVAVISDAAVVISHLMPTSGGAVMPGKTLKCDMIKLKPGDTIEMSVWHTTAASAVCADSLLDSQGNYPIVKKTVSGVAAWCVDIANIGTNASVRLMGRHPNDSGTDLYPRVFVQVLNTVTSET